MTESLRTEFESVYNQFSKEVWALNYARFGDSELAMDMMQEAFMRLWNHWLSNREQIQNARAWLIRVSSNLAQDHIKSSFSKHGTTATEFLDFIQSADAVPAEELEKQERFATVRAAIEELSVLDREILSLRYAFDYNPSEISERLCVPVTAVHMRLTRARKRLAEKLECSVDFKQATA